MLVKAVLFDLYGTLGYVENSVSDEQASRFLVSLGYEVYPQAFNAALQCVSFIDYPKHGYKDWFPYLKRVLQRLDIKPDEKTLRKFARLYEQTQWKVFPDAEEAVKRAKDADLKTAIVTTIAKFKYKKALKSILEKIDVSVDGYTFRCEKSNPRIYLKTLEALGVKAREAVMIGDDVGLDVLLPKRLGMRTILLDRNGQLSTSSLEADAVVGSLSEALEKIVGMS